MPDAAQPGEAQPDPLDLGDARLRAALRARLRADPDLILGDRALVSALVAAETPPGARIVDLRGVAMARLEARIDRLEDSHRAVIAAAYENLAGTAQVHRAVLALMAAERLDDLLWRLGGEVADILRVDAVRLVLESPALAVAGAEGCAARAEAAALEERLGPVLAMRAAGFADAHLGAAPAGILLRPAVPTPGGPFDGRAPRVSSEALVRLDLGADRGPALLALGATDPQRFTPRHGTDLLAFLGGVLARQVAGHLGA